MIWLRETGLRALLGRADREVLNPVASAAPPLPPSELAEALARCLLGLKAEAISADGTAVDYDTLRQSAAYAELAALRSQLHALDLGQLGARNAQLAFWINLYNALVIDAVISYGVRGSVRDLAGGLAFFRRAAYQIGGERFSLEVIEHAILRANAGNPLLPGAQLEADDPRLRWLIAPPDPRIHCALNCAARACPPIGVYRAAQLEAQLELACRAFVAADLEWDEARATATMSEIFDWYAADFGGAGGMLSFVLRYLPENDPRAQAIRARETIRLRHRPYDWRLNQR